MVYVLSCMKRLFINLYEEVCGRLGEYLVGEIKIRQIVIVFSYFFKIVFGFF